MDKGLTMKPKIESALELFLKSLEEAKGRSSGSPMGSWSRPGAFPGKRIPGGGIFVKSIRKGKKRLRPKCPPGKVYKEGRCMRVGGLEKIKLLRAARKRKLKLRRKMAQALLKRAKTMRKRKALGLR